MFQRKQLLFTIVLAPILLASLIIFKFRHIQWYNIGYLNSQIRNFNAILKIKNKLHEVNCNSFSF